MSLFVSHSSLDGDAVRTLVRGLEASGRDVWLDQDLVGGEAWWNAILTQIRGCDVFVFALSEHSLESHPCIAEFEYAMALGRPVLPVEVGTIAPEERRNYAVYSEQVVDYREPTAESAIALLRALAEREATCGPLPEPLPPEPPVPYEYLLRLGSVIRGRADISRVDQQMLLAQLRVALREERSESVRSSIRSLLKSLRDRPDTTYGLVIEIDGLLGPAPDPESPLEDTASSDGPSDPPSRPEPRLVSEPDLVSGPALMPEPELVPEPGLLAEPDPQREAPSLPPTHVSSTSATNTTSPTLPLDASGLVRRAYTVNGVIALVAALLFSVLLVSKADDSLTLVLLGGYAVAVGAIHVSVAIRLTGMARGLRTAALALGLIFILCGAIFLLLMLLDEPSSPVGIIGVFGFFGAIAFEGVLSLWILTDVRRGWRVAFGLVCIAASVLAYPLGSADAFAVIPLALGLAHLAVATPWAAADQTVAGAPA